MSSTKEITESLGFGVIFAIDVLKAAVDYAGGKKPTDVIRAGKNTVIASPRAPILCTTSAKTKKWWPWL